MSDWLSAAEIAALALPGLPGTKPGIHQLAQRQGWASRARPGRGGGREYPVSALPREARVALAERRLAVPAPMAAPAAAHRLIVDPRGQSRADARLALVAAAEAFALQAGVARGAGFAAFAALYNAGRAGVDPQIVAAGPKRHGQPHISARSLENWRARAARDGVARLAGAYQPHNRGTGAIAGDRDLADFVAAQVMARPHIRAGQVRDAIRARFGRDIPLRSIQRHLAEWRELHADDVLAVTNPDGWKSGRRASFGSASAGVIRLNQVWEIDGSPADVMTSDGRHMLIGLVDVYSRRAMVLVTPTAKAVAAASLLRRAILAWGMPEVLKTDNGSDYCAAHMRRALADLSIRHQVCPPFTPEGKPHIERFFGTLTRGLISLLPGFIGHSVADRKVLEGRKAFSARLGHADELIQVSLSAADLQAAIDRWLDTVYHHASHEGLGQSPFARAASWPAPIAKPDPRALDVLLQEAAGTNGIRVVGKSGLQVDGATFIAPELGVWIGRRVHVRRDPEDMGRIVVYSADDGTFVCVAECPERTGLDRRAVAMEARALQAEAVKQARADARAARRKWTPERVADEILAAGARDTDSLVAFPRPVETYETPALAEAARAAAGRAPIAPLTDEQEARAAAQIAKMAARTAAPAPVSDPDRRPDHSDEALARWILAHPDQADEYDRQWLSEKCRSWSFRVLIGVEQPKANVG